MWMIDVEEFLMLRDLFNKGSSISEALSRTGERLQMECINYLRISKN
jgi:hypothetical protein